MDPWNVYMYTPEIWIRRILSWTGRCAFVTA